MFEFEWYVYVGIFFAGLGAGYINTLAGSGSLITLPLLIFFGLPPTVANGTNRVGVLLQTLTATVSFQKQGFLQWRQVLSLLVASMAGALVGSAIAVNLDQQTMRQTIGVMMLVMLVVLFIQPKRWLTIEAEVLEKRPSWVQLLLFFGIGIYGGFIQAGVGVFLLAALVLSIGYDLVHANAVKSLLVFGFTAVALIVFIVNDQINWGMGIALAIGNSIGGWVAAKTAVKQGAAFVRWLLIIVVFIASLNLFGVFSWISQFF